VHKVIASHNLFKRNVEGKNREGSTGWQWVVQEAQPGMNTLTEGFI
jgi:hypothetical protein